MRLPDNRLRKKGGDFRRFFDDFDGNDYSFDRQLSKNRSNW